MSGRGYIDPAWLASQPAEVRERIAAATRSEPERTWRRQDFDAGLARRMRGPAPDRLAEFAAQRQARIDAQLPGQAELDLFGGAE